MYSLSLLSCIHLIKPVPCHLPSYSYKTLPSEGPLDNDSELRISQKLGGFSMFSSERNDKYLRCACSGFIQGTS